MKKIALAMVYTKINYGTVLQAYATQLVLDSLGYYTETIEQREIDKTLKRKKIFYFISHVFEKDLLKTKRGMIKKILLKKINYHSLKSNEIVRKNRFDKFVNENFKFTPAFKTIDDLKRYINDFNTVIVGSDQIWLPQHIEAGYYTLEWVPDNISRMSLSTSFGTKSIPHNMEQKAIHYLSKINYLSVREETGAEIIYKLTNRNAKVLCDPTMMISSKTWEQVAGNPYIENEPYILCYFLGTNMQHRNFALRLKQHAKCRIIALIHMDEYFEYDEEYADETPYDVGPAEFLGLIRNAKYVCTDSYHATVFSVLFHKEFFVFPRFEDKNKMSTNSRITTLLQHLGLMDRFIRNEEQKVANIYYEEVEEKILDLKKQAYDFIVNSIGI